MGTFMDLNVDSRTRGHSWKIAKKRSKLDIGKFFSVRVVQRLSGFKKALGKRRKIQMDFFMD